MSKLNWDDKSKNVFWEGVEMTDENSQKRFGCLEIVYSFNDRIIGYYTTEHLYLIGNSEREAILNIINLYKVKETSYSFDSALDERHGFSKESKTVLIRDVELMLEMINDFILIEKIPDTVKIEDYQEFDDELDKYYARNE